MEILELKYTTLKIKDLLDGFSRLETVEERTMNLNTYHQKLPNWSKVREKKKKSSMCTCTHRKWTDISDLLENIEYPNIHYLASLFGIMKGCKILEEIIAKKVLNVIKNSKPINDRHSISSKQEKHEESLQRCVRIKLM